MFHGFGVTNEKSLRGSTQQRQSAHFAVFRIELLEDRFLLSGDSAREFSGLRATPDQRPAALFDSHSLEPRPVSSSMRQVSASIRQTSDRANTGVSISAVHQISSSRQKGMAKSSKHHESGRKVWSPLESPNSPLQYDPTAGGAGTTTSSTGSAGVIDTGPTDSQGPGASIPCQPTPIPVPLPNPPAFPPVGSLGKSRPNPAVRLPVRSQLDPVAVELSPSSRAGRGGGLPRRPALVARRANRRHHAALRRYPILAQVIAGIDTTDGTDRDGGHARSTAGGATRHSRARARPSIRAPLVR